MRIPRLRRGPTRDSITAYLPEDKPSAAQPPNRTKRLPAPIPSAATTALEHQAMRLAKFIIKKTPTAVEVLLFRLVPEFHPPHFKLAIVVEPHAYAQWREYFAKSEKTSSPARAKAALAILGIDSQQADQLMGGEFEFDLQLLPRDWTESLPALTMEASGFYLPYFEAIRDQHRVLAISAKESRMKVSVLKRRAKCVAQAIIEESPSALEALLFHNWPSGARQRFWLAVVVKPEAYAEWRRYFVSDWAEGQSTGAADRVAKATALLGLNPSELAHLIGDEFELDLFLLPRGWKKDIAALALPGPGFFEDYFAHIRDQGEVLASRLAF